MKAEEYPDWWSKEFQAYCDHNKFKYVVCKSVDEFINEVNDYLN